MIQNKKGLSAVVTTLIIILLTIVAIMIIWGVVKGMIDKNKTSLETSSSCLDLDLRATKVKNITGQPGNYSVTLTRSSGGDTIDGAELVLSSEDNSTDVVLLEEEIAPLAIKVIVVEAGFSNASSVRVSPYFYDEKENKQRCTESVYQFKAIRSE